MRLRFSQARRPGLTKLRKGLVVSVLSGITGVSLFTLFSAQDVEAGNKEQNHAASKSADAEKSPQLLEGDTKNDGPVPHDVSAASASAQGAADEPEGRTTEAQAFDPSKGYKDPREFEDNSKFGLETPFGQISWPDISDKVYYRDGKAMVDYKEFRLVLTLNTALQNLIIKDLINQKYVSVSMVVMESSTGRILSMAERRGEAGDPLTKDKSSLVAARAPAASLMKIVTAAAAIEKTGIDPETEIAFRGGCRALHHQNWLRDPGLDRQKLTFAKAFGSSCNTVFSRLALYWTGLGTLRQYAERFMFNKPIPSDLKFDTSVALLPEQETATTLEVGEAGAGFGASKLSPVHAAMLSAAAGNNGVMMAPHIVDEAFDKAGKLVYKAKPKVISQVYSPETAEKMLQLMHATVESGTSRKYFRRRKSGVLGSEVGGKTGTLSDAEARQTLYTWFSGSAPLFDEANVSIGTLVASPQNWVVRATKLAQSGLSHYLRLERENAKVANTVSQ
jgi:peptidoglycan glycosyltransferase